MTDRETIEALLTKIGVKFTTSVIATAWMAGDQMYPKGIAVGDVSLATREPHYGQHTASFGYPGFYTEFIFSSEGELKGIGAWE